MMCRAIPFWKIPVTFRPDLWRRDCSLFTLFYLRFSYGSCRGVTATARLLFFLFSAHFHILSSCALQAHRAECIIISLVSITYILRNDFTSILAHADLTTFLRNESRIFSRKFTCNYFNHSINSRATFSYRYVYSRACFTAPIPFDSRMIHKYKFRFAADCGYYC